MEPFSLLWPVASFQLKKILEVSNYRYKLASLPPDLHFRFRQIHNILNANEFRNSHVQIKPQDKREVFYVRIEFQQSFQRYFL